jgi:predicted ABC-type ATPase
MSDPNRLTVVVLAGINGAGKTTASREIIQSMLRVPVFVNADTLARGLNAFDPESEAAKAGRVMLEHLHELAAKRRSFAFETTLSGRAYAPWLESLRATGYEVELFYYWLRSPEQAIRRVADRVRAGGHPVPDDTVRRRYRLSIQNFFRLYRPVADRWRVYNNSRGMAHLIAFGSGDRQHILDGDTWLAFEGSAGDG